VAVPLGGVGWAAVLLVSGTLVWVDVPAAVAVAAANVAIGVLIRQVIGLALRRPRALS
jgi:hypothetical protein